MGGVARANGAREEGREGPALGNLDQRPRARDRATRASGSAVRDRPSDLQHLRSFPRTSVVPARPHEAARRDRARTVRRGRAYRSDTIRHGISGRRLASGVLRRRPARRGGTAGKGAGSALERRRTDAAGAGATILSVGAGGVDGDRGNAPRRACAPERRGGGARPTGAKHAVAARRARLGEKLVSLAAGRGYWSPSAAAPASPASPAPSGPPAAPMPDDAGAAASDEHLPLHC